MVTGQAELQDIRNKINWARQSGNESLKSAARRIEEMIESKIPPSEIRQTQEFAVLLKYYSASGSSLNRGR